MKEHLLVIDTNKYSGNFERSLYKFLTCNENDDVYDMSDMILKHGDTIDPILKDWFKSNLQEYVFDEEYGYQPVGIIETPNYKNNGMGKHLHVSDPEVDTWKGKWPAYQSVGIAISTNQIPDEIVALIKERILRYLELGIEPNLVVENFRIVTIETDTTETTVEI